MALEIKTAESQPKPHTRLLPILVPSRTGLHADIPITPVGKDGRRDDVGEDPVWAAKSGKLYWVSPASGNLITGELIVMCLQRGLATGIMHNKKFGPQWMSSHRERLHLLTNDQSSDPKPVLIPIGSSGQAEMMNFTARELSEYYMDVKMSGGAWQCDWGDGSCDEMKWVADSLGMGGQS